MNTSLILVLLLTEISLGMYLILLHLPMEDLGKYFFKFHAALFLWLLAVSLIFRWHAGGTQGHSRTAMVLLGAFWLGIAALRFLWDRGRRVPLLEAALAALAGAVMFWDAQALVRLFEPLGAKRHLLWAAFPAEAMLLGSVMLAMILGHWYLVVPKLSEKHLERLTLVFCAALAARTALLIPALALHWEPYGKLGFSFDSVGAFLDFGVFFWQRLLFGILAPWPLAYMIWNTARIRSTQSATGILYTAVALVLVGEALGKYFLLRFGIPL